jgi:RimJ/RimL family protein N-acetyltransferase
VEVRPRARHDGDMKPALRLTDGVVTLEPSAGAHVNELVVAVRESLAELQPWLPWARPGFGAADATDWIRACAHAAAQGLDHEFAVLDAAGRFSGGVGIRVTDAKNRVASIGYWTRTSAARRGHATRAVRLAAAHAFDQLGVLRVEIHARPENAGSRRVAERAGAAFECIARNRLVQHGVPYAAALYSLVPDDLQPLSSRPTAS